MYCIHGDKKLFLYTIHLLCSLLLMGRLVKGVFQPAFKAKISKLQLLVKPNTSPCAANIHLAQKSYCRLLLFCFFFSSEI